MSVTPFQREVCRLIAKNRIEEGESYVAGGAALNAIIGAARQSRDVDIFHDTSEALEASWRGDRELLQRSGLDVDEVINRPGLIEALVRRGSDRTALQWTHDSAFRFFPLVEHLDFGLTLHPFDLATNKVLALTGRLEVRDWIDVIACHERLQNLGYLVWGAAGKDPGLSPAFIIQQAGRSARYTQVEIDQLQFDGEAPNVVGLSSQWREILAEAQDIIDGLPAIEVGKCVLDTAGNLVRLEPAQLAQALSSGQIRFHEGALRGAFPLPADQNGAL